MPCLRPTCQRRVSKIKADVEVTFQNDLKSSLAYSPALDELGYILGNLQLAVFV